MKSKKLKISSYLSSYEKRTVDCLLSFLILLLISPVFVVIAFLVAFTSGFPIFFLQKRKGLNGKVFEIIKFRTMVNNASVMQIKYKRLNESDGPVFKIKNDPRFTKIGRLLSNVGLDELPQFINVLRGDMSIVGPRPLPVKEALRLSNFEKVRESARPGITSNWVVNGSHKLSFKKWMNLDRDYVQEADFLLDLNIIYRTFYIIWRSMIEQFTNH